MLDGDRPAARASSSSSSSRKRSASSGCSAPRRRGGPRATTRPRRSATRLALYHEQTEPLVEYYRVRGNLVGVRADRPVQEVFAEIQRALEQVGGPVIIRKSAEEIERMARAGVVVADVLALLGERARPGVTHRGARRASPTSSSASHDGVPTFKGYRGYPAAICTSPNAMVVHGIPGPYTLDEGDILSVDVGVTLDGFVADSAYTFAIGEISRRGGAPARGVPGRARRRDRAVQAPATASRTSRTRSRTPPRRAASPS